MSDETCAIVLLEGIDRLGKTTQTKLLVDEIAGSGKRVSLIKSPVNDGFSYRVIYWMLGNGLARRLPNIFQTIQFVNKLIFQTFWLPRMRRNNDVIVFDRWSLSAWAYGVPDGAWEWLTKWMLNRLIEPDYTIILDGNPHVDGDGDSYESDAAYQKEVRARYVQWLVMSPDTRVIQVNANQPVQDVARDIKQFLHVPLCLEEHRR